MTDGARDASSTSSPTRRAARRGRFDDWLALFADDGHYWVPLQGAAQADPLTHNVARLRRPAAAALRIERLKNPRAHSQHPRSRCQHVLQRARVEQRRDAGTALVLRTPSSTSRPAASAATARRRLPPPLVRTASGWAIRQKRVDLLKAGRRCRPSSCSSERSLIPFHPPGAPDMKSLMQTLTRTALAAALGFGLTATALAADLKVA
jgi:hypothetical protein